MHGQYLPFPDGGQLVSVYEASPGHRERASLDRSLQSLRESCSRTVIPIQLPIGEEKSFKGVVDLVTKKAHVFQADEILVEEAGIGGAVLDILRVRQAPVKPLPPELRERLRGVPAA